MSTKNIEILRSLYAEMPFDPLTVRPDLLEEFFDPEIEWTGPREFPDLGERTTDTRASPATAPSSPRR